MIANCTDIISIGPELAAPQILFHGRLSPKYLSCGDTLEYLNNPSSRKLGMGAAQYMDMVIIHTQSFKFDIISFLNPYRCLSDYFDNFLVQQRFSIFYGKYDMIVDRPGTMISLMDFIRSLFHAPTLAHKVTP